MSQPVSIGDDGSPPGDGDGPLLAALKTWFLEIRDQGRRDQEHARLRLRQARALAQPSYAPQKTNGTIDANGNLVLDISGPMLGRRWAVRMVTFSDAGSFWSSMGGATAALCTGQRNGNTVPPDSVRWPFATGPNCATFGSDQLWVIPADNVLLAISGGTPGQNVQCTIWVQDFNPDDLASTAEI